MEKSPSGLGLVPESDSSEFSHRFNSPPSPSPPHLDDLYTAVNVYPPRLDALKEVDPPLFPPNMYPLPSRIRQSIPTDSPTTAVHADARNFGSASEDDVTYRKSCDECSKRRIRCEGAQPTCKRCETMNLVCVYQIARKRGPRRRAGKAPPAKKPKVSKPASDSVPAKKPKVSKPVSDVVPKEKKEQIVMLSPEIVSAAWMAGQNAALNGLEPTRDNVLNIPIPILPNVPHVPPRLPPLQIPLNQLPLPIQPMTPFMGLLPSSAMTVSPQSLIQGVLTPNSAGTLKDEK
jgi:hypothetical protein